MGISCPNVRQVVHWSAPADVEAYLQERRQAGRGQLACGVLFIAKVDFIPLLVDDDIRTYCKETEVCRRELFTTAATSTVLSKVDLVKVLE